MAGGRPTEYSEALLQQCLDYISDDEEINFKSKSHIIPSLVGLVRVINISKSTLYRWADENEETYHPEFRDILDQLNDFQQFELIQGGLSGAHNATISKLVLGKHGYSEKNETALTGAGGGAIETKWTVEIVDAKTTDT